MITAHRRTKVILLMIITAIAAIAALLFFIVRTGLNGFDCAPTEVFGVVLPGDIKEGGWNKSVFDGFERAINQCGGRLIFSRNAFDDPKLVQSAATYFIGRGANTVIFASPGYADLSKSVISSNPLVDFVSFEGENRDPNLSSYWVRLYQVSYIAGYTAAAMSGTGILGYAAGRPDAINIRNIDAFTLGARAAREDAVVNVIFTGDNFNRSKAEAAADRLIDEGHSEVLAYMMLNDGVSETAKRRRVKYIGFLEDPDKYDRGLMLGMVNVNWERFADLIIKNRMLRMNSHKTRWYGVEDDIVWFDNHCNYLTTAVQDHIKSLEKSFSDGHEVFSGEIRDTEGQLRCRQDEVLSDQTLSKAMLWFVDGVRMLE